MQAIASCLTIARNNLLEEHRWLWNRTFKSVGKCRCYCKTAYTVKIFSREGSQNRIFHTSTPCAQSCHSFPPYFDHRHCMLQEIKGWPNFSLSNLESSVCGRAGAGEAPSAVFGDFLSSGYPGQGGRSGHPMTIRQPTSRNQREAPTDFSSF